MCRSKVEVHNLMETEAHNLFGYRIGTPFVGGSTGLSGLCLKTTWLAFKNGSYWKLPLVGHHKDKMKKEERDEEWWESEQCARARLLSINSHLRIYIRRCMCPTQSWYRATYRNVSWCLLVEAYLFRANAIMRLSTSNHILVTCVHVRVTT